MAGGEKWWDSGYIFQVELTGFALRLDIKRGKERSEEGFWPKQLEG